MSTIKVSNIQHGSAASAAITLDANGQATLNGLAFPTSGSLSGRNRIINGDMRIDQRNAGAAVTPGNGATTYLCDRWRVYKANNSLALTSQRSTTAPSTFTNSLLFSITTGSSPGASDELSVAQSIEGFNIADLGWGTASAQSITLSFWVRSSITGTYAFGLINNGAGRSYIGTYTVNSANTFEYKTITVAGDTSGTWLTDNGAGLIVVFDLGSGSNFQGTAGTWGTGNKYATSGSVKLAATTGATFYITGVQLEAGTVATPFERRSYGQELALCQRYFQLCRNFVGIGNSSTQVIANAIFQCTMRATPTVGQTGVIQVGDGSTDLLQSSTGTNFLNGTIDAAVFQVNNFSGISVNRAHQMRLGANTNAITLSAEL